MLSLNSISAWIEVDGKELEQYGVEEDPVHNVVTCWIATQADKNFTIVFRDELEHRFHSLSSTLRLDGSYIQGKVLRPSHKFRRTVIQDNQLTSTTSAQPFLFSKLELTDEDEYLNQSLAKLGEIQIYIYRTQALYQSPFLPGCLASAHAKIHERSKKAITHCISYGQEVEAQRPYVWHLNYLDGQTPLVTFTFKYRDLGILQASNIVPKPPPVKQITAVSGTVVDLKPEFVDEQIEIVDNNRKTVRRKRLNEGDEKPTKKIKRENKFVSSGEIIDLT